MSTAQGRGRAGGAPRTSWRDRRSNDDSKSAGGRDDVSSRGGSGGYRGRGGARSSTRGARSAPAPRERTHERKDHVTNKDDTAADATNAPRPSPSTLGTCTQMCPRAEVHERTRTMEISRFERPPPGAFVPSHGGEFVPLLLFPLTQLGPVISVMTIRLLSFFLCRRVQPRGEKVPARGRWTDRARQRRAPSTARAAAHAAASLL